jgi:hypothetical protein
MISNMNKRRGEVGDGGNGLAFFIEHTPLPSLPGIVYCRGTRKGNPDSGNWEKAVRGYVELIRGDYVRRLLGEWYP